MAYFNEIITFIILATIWFAISFEFQFEVIRTPANLNETAKYRYHLKFNIMKKNVQYLKSLLTAEQLQKAVKYLVATYIVYICLPTIETK